MALYFNFFEHIERFSTGLVKFAEHYGLSSWDWIAFIISVLAFVVAVYAAVVQYKAYASQKETEKNTNKLKLTEKQQIELLYAMVRHLYRGIVVTATIQTKIKRTPEKIPSIEHLEKLHVETSDVDPEAFVNSGFKAFKLKKLQLELRNYNIEIDTAARYFLMPGISKDAKKHIMDVLMFKPGNLTQTICKILSEQFGEITANDKAFEIVKESHKMTLKRNQDETLHGRLANEELLTANQVEKYCGKKGVFESKADEFLRILNQDISIECGTNANGNDKIFFI